MHRSQLHNTPLDSPHLPARPVRIPRPARCIRYASRQGRSILIGLIYAGFVLFAAAVLHVSPASAQPAPFGSADDPAERVDRLLWTNNNTLDLLAGFSLIGPTWRSATSVATNISTRNLSARFHSTFRAGIDGRYGPDYDEFYDLLRQIDFIRLKVQSRRPLYFRIGPTSRIRLGSGHLVNFFNSTVAWEERTIGGEFMWRSRVVTVSGFTDNIVPEGVIGGRVAIRPLLRSSDERARTFEIGVNYVTDIAEGSLGNPALSGYNVDVSFAAALVGEAMLRPFATLAVLDQGGGGLGFGIDFMSENFVDVARFNIRMAMYYNSPDFRPGYFGAFYQVDNPIARIQRSEDFSPDSPTVGLLLNEIESGNDFETELRFVLFDRFELWYYFRRHFGEQSLSEYHLRLFFQTEKLRAQVGQDRAGLRGYFTLFNDLGDQTALVFQTDYALRGKLWIVIRARYTYERRDSIEGIQQYLVQRRFEPMAGLRIHF